MDEPRPAIVRSVARRIHADEARQAVKARTVPLTRKLRAEDAFRLIVLECLAQVSANAGAVRSSRHAESLHQLRVGLRRLQVALSIFGDERPVLKELQDRAKAIASRLGPARDLDVFADELLPGPAKAAGVGEGFAALRTRAEAARMRAWDAVVECVLSPDFGRFLDDVVAAAERLPALAGRHAWLRSAAARALDENLARVKKRARKAKSAAERDFHRMRIALKKLRYASEFFAPLYRKKTVKRYMSRLRNLQDRLGGINDVAHLRTTLAQLLVDEMQGPHGHGDVCFAAGEIDGWHRARGQTLARGVMHHWNRFKRLDPFWR